MEADDPKLIGGYIHMQSTFQSKEQARIAEVVWIEELEMTVEILNDL